MVVAVHTQINATESELCSMERLEPLILDFKEKSCGEAH